MIPPEISKTIEFCFFFQALQAKGLETIRVLFYFNVSVTNLKKDFLYQDILYKFEEYLQILILIIMIILLSSLNNKWNN